MFQTYVNQIQLYRSYSTAQIHIKYLSNIFKPQIEITCISNRLDANMNAQTYMKYVAVASRRQRRHW